MFRRLLFALCGILIVFVAQANLFNNKPSFLRAEQAFILSLQQNSDGVQANWQIAEDYYLYKKEIQIQIENATSAEIAFPVAEKYQDEFFGEVEIYRNQLDLFIPIISQTGVAKLKISYQGCTKGLCYPPETQEIILKPSVKTSSNSNSTPKATALMAEQDRLAQQLFNSQYASLWFFVLGLGLAFTPCVLPMLPLLSAIVIGQQRPSTARAFTLSFVYVQGMAFTYTLLGLSVAAIGLPFQIALQSPYVLIALSIIFILLALSMFGLFNLQLPNRWQNKLTQWSQRQKSGALGGVFIMGLLAGLIASPCTTAPLSGALLYVAQSGDLVTGGLTLYLLALGMGLPLMLITLFGNKILPKSGAWINNVKIAFGFVMLALPIFLLSRVLSAEWEPRLWALLGTSFFIWLSEQMRTLGFGWLLRILFFALAIICAKPLQDWAWHNQIAVSNINNSRLHFQRINSYAQLQQVLSLNQDKLVMLDLYADWCVACKEFEQYTFSDPAVQQTLSEMLLLQVNLTKNSELNRELLQKLNVIGLPSILFFNPQGREIANSRLTGFLTADAFLKWLQQLKSLNEIDR